VMRLGYGIAAVSRLVVTDELKMGSLVVLPVFPTKIRRTFSIIRIRDAALTSAAQHFLAVLRDHCATRNLIRL
jgi:DNA-binding transcriptional LysR family regulator